MNTQSTPTMTLLDASCRHASAHTAQLSRGNDEQTGGGQRAPWLNATTFDRLLTLLGPDSEAAGQRYEAIRGRLIGMFRARRCVFAEDLADATFERVAQKLAYLTDSFTGDSSLYIYGVAKKIYLEYQRKNSAAPLNTDFFHQPSSDNEDLENLMLRLDEALSAIPKSDRDLILSYYSGSKRNKIIQRRALAQQFGLGPNALRLRVFRIRKQIRNYMLRSSSKCD
jgi:RNA polymerase sigma factor (sigma-70 family)